MMLELNDRIFIVEIDENQHKSYKNDNDWIYKISDVMYYKNVFVIRFNPDKYSVNNFSHPSCWKKENGKYKINNKQELNYRLNKLENVINDCILYDPKESIELIYLFYDQNNIDDQNNKCFYDQNNDNDDQKNIYYDQNNNNVIIKKFNNNTRKKTNYIQ